MGIFNTIGRGVSFDKVVKQAGINLTFALKNCHNEAVEVDGKLTETPVGSLSPVGKTGQDMTSWSDDEATMRTLQGIAVAVGAETRFTKVVVRLNAKGKYDSLAFYID